MVIMLVASQHGWKGSCLLAPSFFALSPCFLCNVLVWAGMELILLCYVPLGPGPCPGDSMSFPQGGSGTEMESSPVLSSGIFLDIGKMTNTSPLTVAAHPACETLKKPLPALAAPRPHCTTTCPVWGLILPRGCRAGCVYRGPACVAFLVGGGRGPL